MRKSGVDARACAVLVLFIALSCCGADAESKPAPSPRLRAAIERLDTSQKQYYEQMKSVMPYYDDGGNRLELEDKNKDWETPREKLQWEAVPRMDSVLRECLLVVFDELRDVARVRQALEGVAVVREVPCGTFDMRSNPPAPSLPGVDMPFKTHLSEKEKLPEVLCWSVESKAGADIFVLQHSLVRPMAGWARGLTDPYILTVFPAESHPSTISPYKGQGETSFESPYPPAFFDYFLDAVETEGDYPHVLIMDYQVARAVQFGIARLAFDTAARQWRVVGGAPLEQLGLSPDVYYDPETQRLHYSQQRERFGESESMVFDVRKWEHVEASEH